MSAVLGALLLAAGIEVATAEDFMGATVTSRDGVSKNSYGECWRTNYDGKAREECGDIEPDEDGDGVPDSRDKCPGTPKGVKVDDDGCPLDSDGDGVPDYLDRCPGTPAGAKVDEFGCEIIPKLTLSDINFAFDSASLTAAAKRLIDDEVEQIRQSGALRNAQIDEIRITGHTDSTGPANYNQMLSERRANTVASYLKSVAEQRIDDLVTVVGMGETAPIASNSTREGRAQNRRVEVEAIMKR
jgi:OOP family OmpA-OmpF porin